MFFNLWFEINIFIFNCWISDWIVFNIFIELFGFILFVGLFKIKYLGLFINEIVIDNFCFIFIEYLLIFFLIYGFILKVLIIWFVYFLLKLLFNICVNNFKLNKFVLFLYNLGCLIK